jgi:UDP-N-acetylmuramyl tripeptide synthase
MGTLRFEFSKLCGKTVLHLMRFGKGLGKSFPGKLFLQIGSFDALKELAKTPQNGNILITGTNGKTTTTKIIIKLLENEYKLSSSFESNTINAIATGLLKGNSDLGVFEYGIRNIAYGIPDLVCKYVNPVCVVYTNVTREHTQVLGVKNSFKDYLFAKSLLSKCMNHGVIIANSDDVYTSFIGEEKKNDVHINYFGFDLKEDSSSNLEELCPDLAKKLFAHDDNVYESEYGIKKPEPDVKITKIDFNKENWRFKIEGNPYNYFLKESFEFEFDCNFPPLGLYNLYNGLAAITTYVTFTSNINNVEKIVKSVFDSLNNSILPSGRFQTFFFNNKVIGIGQGDNGSALKANSDHLEFYMCHDSRKRSRLNIEFIYSTPDNKEEEIFEDHLVSIKSIDPSKIYIIPGRTSVEMGEKCFKAMQNVFDTEFYPIAYENMDERVKKVIELINNSDADYIIASGCGEEFSFWENVQKELIEQETVS